MPNIIKLLAFPAFPYTRFCYTLNMISWLAYSAQLLSSKAREYLYRIISHIYKDETLKQYFVSKWKSVYMHMADDSANLHNSNEHSTISQLEYSFTQSVIQFFSRSFKKKKAHHCLIFFQYDHPSWISLFKLQLMCSLKKIDQFVFRAMQNISRD